MKIKTLVLLILLDCIALLCLVLLTYAQVAAASYAMEMSTEVMHYRIEPLVLFQMLNMVLANINLVLFPVFALLLVFIAARIAGQTKKRSTVIINALAFCLVALLLNIAADASLAIPGYSLMVYFTLPGNVLLTATTQVSCALLFLGKSTP